MEELLNRFSRKSPPEELRKRVLDAAAKKKDQAKLLSPFLMKATLASAVIAAAFLIIDASLEGGQKKSLATLTERQQASAQKWDDQSFIFDEFVAGDSNASWAILQLKIGRRAKEKEAQAAKKELSKREIDEY